MGGVDIFSVPGRNLGVAYGSCAWNMESSHDATEKCSIRNVDDRMVE